MRKPAAPTPLGRVGEESVPGRRRLRFPDALERAYRDDHFARWLPTTRLALLLGVCTLALFGLVDPWAAPRSWRSIVVIRGVACAGVLTVLAASFRPGFRRVAQPAVALAVVIVGGALAAMEVVLEPDEPAYELYVFGMMIVAFFGYTAPRLRFWYATAAGWTVAASAAAVAFVHHPLHPMAEVAVTLALMVAANVVGMLAAFFIDSGSRRTYLDGLRLARERQRSDALLVNALPAPIAERLKAGDSVADHYDEVTVSFADLVGFTALAGRLSPDELVAFLGETFSRIDRLARLHGVEKIKTIGDSYMAVRGIPIACRDTAGPVADLALDTIETVGAVRERWGVDVDVRIGIHTGPAVAGVIGLDRFSYDLWGDTVNTASRMESHAVPGTIQTTEETYDRLRDRYEFEGPSTIDVKGKGLMPVFCLIGPRAAVP